MNQLRSYLRTRTASKFISIILSMALLITMVPFSALADEDGVIDATHIAIRTAAPLNGQPITDGAVTVTGGTAAVTWSSDGESYATASGTFATSTVYRTKYVLTADIGYVFDPAPGVYEKDGERDLSGSIAMLGSEPFIATFTSTVSTGFTLNDTLTIIVTWPNATIEPSDISIGTIAPVVGAAIEDGTNTFNKGTINTSWKGPEGNDFIPAGGNFSGNSVYTTRYVFTANKGFSFDTTSGIYIDGAKSLRSRMADTKTIYSFSGDVTTKNHDNDTLTLNVMWNLTGEETSLPIIGAEDITIGTVAPVPFAVPADGTNTFNHARFDGMDWIPKIAPGATFESGVTYKSEYYLFSSNGYRFDKPAQYRKGQARDLSSRILNLGSGTYTIESSFDNIMYITVTWPQTGLFLPNDIFIGTSAPVGDATMANGTNTFSNSSAEIDWSTDNGATYKPASGKYEYVTTYKTKYVITAGTGYFFDSTLGVYEDGGGKTLKSRIANLGSGTYTAVVSGESKDILTIVVTWPQTAAASFTTIDASDMSISTIAPVTGANIANGTNVFAHTTASVKWSADNGKSYADASGTFAPGKAYQTKYVLTTEAGYIFDSTAGAFDSISILNLGSGAVSTQVSTTSTSNDTLTITVTWPTTALATISANDLVIGTSVPVTGESITDGANTFPHASSTVTWSSDDGVSYAAANGTYAPRTVYKTKYILTADSGYRFDSAKNVYNAIAVENLNGVTLSADVSTSRTTNDILTIVVTWPATVAATILPADISIGTVAPVTGATQANGTNTFSHMEGAVTWSSDDGASYAEATGTYAAAKNYKTKYVLTAMNDYAFDSAGGAYEKDGAKDLSNRIVNLGTSTFSATVSTVNSSNDTLTIVVTWPTTGLGMIVPADISIVTAAPITGANQSNGSNTFNHASSIISWSSDDVGSYQPASGTFAIGKRYKTKYVLTADENYQFDSTAGAYNPIVITNLDDPGTFSAQVSTTKVSNDTLTIVVTWPVTAITDTVKVNINNSSDFRTYSGNKLIPAQGLTVSSKTDYSITLVNGSINTNNPSAPLTAAMVKSILVEDGQGNELPSSVEIVSTGVAQYHPWSLKITIGKNKTAVARMITVTVDTDTAQRIDIRSLNGFTIPTINYTEATPRSSYPNNYGNYFYSLPGDLLNMQTSSSGLIPAGIQLVGKNTSKMSPTTSTLFDTTKYQFGYTFLMPSEPIFLSVTSTDGKAAHDIIINATIPGVVTPTLTGGYSFEKATVTKPARDYAGDVVTVDPGNYNRRIYKVTGIEVRSKLLNVVLPVTVNTNGTYSFVMPFTDANVTVLVQKNVSLPIEAEIISNENAEVTLDLDEYYKDDRLNVQIVNKDPSKYVKSVIVNLEKGSNVDIHKDLYILKPYDSTIDMNFQPIWTYYPMSAGEKIKIVITFDTVVIPVTTTKTEQFSSYPTQVGLNEPITFSFTPPSDSSKIYKPKVQLRDRLGNKTVYDSTYVSSDLQDQTKSVYTFSGITKSSIAQVELLYDSIDTNSPAAAGAPGVPGAPVTKLRNISYVSPNSKLVGTFNTINVFGTNMNGQGEVYIGTEPTPTVVAKVTDVTATSMVVQVPSNMLPQKTDVTYYVSSNGVQRSVTIPSSENIYHTKFGYLSVVSDSKFNHSVIISDSEKDLKQQLGNRKPVMTIKGSFTANPKETGEYVFSGTTTINGGLTVYHPTTQSLLNVHDDSNGTVSVSMEKVNMTAGSFTVMALSDGSISLDKGIEYISDYVEDEDEDGDGEIENPSKQNIEIKMKNRNNLTVVGSGMQADITGAKLLENTVIFDGKLLFGMAMPGGNTLGIDLDIDRLEYGIDGQGNLSFQGVKAEGSFTPANDISKHLLGGFGINGSAEGSVDTFKGKYAVGLDIDAKLANIASSMSLKKDSTTGKFFPDSIKIIVGLENGIPVTPMTPIAKLTRVGGGVSGLADTISGNYNGFPPILILLNGNFEVGSLTPGAGLLEFNDVELAIGPSQISLSGNPTLLKMEIFDKFKAGIYMTKSSVSYEMEVAANILKNFSVILAGGKANLTYYGNNDFNLNGQLHGRLEIPNFNIGAASFGPYSLSDNEVGLSNTNAYAAFKVLFFGFKVNYAFDNGEFTYGRRSFAFAPAPTGTVGQTMYDENGVAVGQINAFSNIQIVASSVPSSGSSNGLLRMIAVQPTISMNDEGNEHMVSFPAGLTEDYAVLVSADPNDLQILDPNGDPYGLIYPGTLDDGTPYYADPNANAAVMSENTVMISLGKQAGNWTIKSSQLFDSSVIAIAPIPEIAGTSYDAGTHQVSWDLTGLDTATENYQVEVRLSTDNGEDPNARSAGVLLHTVEVGASDLTDKVASGSYTFTEQDMKYLQSGQYYARVTLIGKPISDDSRLIPYASKNATQVMSVVNSLAPGSISEVVVSPGGGGTIHATWDAVTGADGYIVRLYDADNNAILSPLTYTDEIGIDGKPTGKQIAHAGRPIEYQVLADNAVNGEFTVNLGGIESGNRYKLTVTPFAYADLAGDEEEADLANIYGPSTITDVVAVPLVKTPVIHVKPSMGVITKDALLGNMLTVGSDFTLDLATTYVNTEDGQTQDLNTKFTVSQSDGTIDQDTNLPKFVSIYVSDDYENLASVPIIVDGDAGSTLIQIVAENDQGDISEYGLAVHYNSLPPVLFVETEKDGKIVADSAGRYKIKGSTVSHATVLDDRGNRTKADEAGEFSLTGTLSSSKQAYITVTASDSVGNVAQDDVSVVRSSKPADPGTGPDTGNGSGSNNGSSNGDGSGSGPSPSSGSGSIPVKDGGQNTDDQTDSSTNNGISAEKKTFKDVHTEAAWAEEAIERAYKLGMVSGRRADIFDPNSNTRRDEAISMLVRARNLNIDKQADLDAAAAYFADWNELAKWSRPYIAAAYANGLVAGTERNGKHYISGSSLITRVEVAVLFQNAYQLTEDEVNRKIFGDVIPTWAANSVNILSSNGIINGYPDSTFQPVSNATRAEIVVMLIRLIDQQEKVELSKEK